MLWLADIDSFSCLISYRMTFCQIPARPPLLREDVAGIWSVHSLVTSLSHDSLFSHKLLKRLMHKPWVSPESHFSVRATSVWFMNVCVMDRNERRRSEEPLKVSILQNTTLSVCFWFSAVETSPTSCLFALNDCCNAHFLWAVGCFLERTFFPSLNSSIVELEGQFAQKLWMFLWLMCKSLRGQRSRWNEK